MQVFTLDMFLDCSCYSYSFLEWLEMVVVIPSLCPVVGAHGRRMEEGEDGSVHVIDN